MYFLRTRPPRSHHSYPSILATKLYRTAYLLTWHLYYWKPHLFIIPKDSAMKLMRIWSPLSPQSSPSSKRHHGRQVVLQYWACRNPQAISPLRPSLLLRIHQNVRSRPPRVLQLCHQTQHLKRLKALTLFVPNFLAYYLNRHPHPLLDTDFYQCWRRYWESFGTLRI